MRDRDENLEIPTIIMYLILSILFIWCGNLEIKIVGIFIVFIIGVILYNKFKSRKQ